MRKQRLDAKTEYDIKYPDENADDDNACQNDERVIDRLLTSGPNDLAAFAFQLAEPLADACKETGFFRLGFFSHAATSFLLLRLAVQRVLTAETAVLLHFQTVRIVLLVLLGVVVALFALSTRKGNFNSHFRHLLFFCPSGL